MSAARATVSEVSIPLRDATLAGDLTLREPAIGIVAFAHGSGSSRHSPRNKLVAETFNQAAIGTLLLDLLTPEEDREDQITGEYRFDLTLLANRLLGAVDWLITGPAGTLPRGLFGASTGAAAALMAAAERPDDVAAIVSRGGRPDLAGAALPRVRAPTLLIVGSEDRVVLELNEYALEHLRSEKQLAIVPGATHLFEEPGALEQAARAATDWFSRYLEAS